jgi:hypothetical protein
MSAELDNLVEELARELAIVVWSPHRFDQLSEHNKRYCREKARDLVARGWSKSEPTP